jgi:hypothetical protein
VLFKKFCWNRVLSQSEYYRNKIINRNAQETNQAEIRYVSDAPFYLSTQKFRKLILFRTISVFQSDEFYPRNCREMEPQQLFLWHEISPVTPREANLKVFENRMFKEICI